MKHWNATFMRIYAVILLLIASLVLPLTAASNASAIASIPVCQEAAVTQEALTAPVLLTPSNGATSSNGFDFSWAAVNGAVWYDWQSALTPELRYDGGFADQLSYHRLDTTSINEGGSPQDTYYWHVRPVAADGTTGPWSQTWKVTLDNAQSSYLGAPTLLLPASNAVCNIYDQNFDFMWNAPVSDGGKGPLAYIYQSGHSLATDPTTGEFTDQPWTDYNIPNTSIFDGPSPSATYYWHIRAVGADGSLGPWSATWIVTIKNEAPVVETPPTDTLEEVPAPMPASSPVANPVVATTSSKAAAPSLLTPAITDIASALGTDIYTAPTSKSAINKPSKQAHLTANVGEASRNLFSRNALWIVGLILILSAAIFAYARRSQVNEK